MNLHWFLSATVRHAGAMCKHVRKLIHHQRDLLSPKVIEEVDAAIAAVEGAIKAKAGKAELEKQMDGLEKAAAKWLRPYPNANVRENVEVLLVALTVAMGIRTFFLQPFKIPTGSMQPTLFGVTSTPDFFSSTRSQADVEEQLRLRDALEIPGRLQRIKEWFEGKSYVRFVAPEDGEFQGAEAPVPSRIISIYQKIHFAGKTHTIWFPPDYGQVPVERRAGLRPGLFFRKGEEVLKLQVRAGDHLFVDRVSYNFVPPNRGDIIVFQTKGIQALPQGEFYIKRLVALPNERVQIGDDRHLVINDTRLDASTPHFEFVYSFDPKLPPRESEYSGHVNGKVAEASRPGGSMLAPLFLDSSEVRTVPANHFMVMGDNTMNSLDSRSWGSFSSTNVIGKSFFVYWPLTKHFGWGYR